MRVLVTGGAGYIGSHTVRRLLAAGHAVVVFDSLATGHRRAVPPELLVVGDLRDIDHIDHLLVVHRIEAVIHFAALALVGESVVDPARYYTTNLTYALQLLDRCRRNGVGRFVFSSSAAVYGVPETVPIPEDAPTRPVNPYGHSKLAFEWALADYAAAYALGSCALRYFNAAGAAPDATLGEDHDPETHLIPSALLAAAGRRPHLDIFGTDYPTPDGTCVRDFVHVEDLAAAHVLALEAVRPGSRLVYNVGIGRGSSVRQVVAAVEEVTGRPVPVREAPRRPGDPPELVANADRIRRDLGWSPRYTDLKAIVQTAWDWHRTHPHGFGDRDV